MSDFVCMNGSPKFCLVPSGYGSMVLAGSAQFFLILRVWLYLFLVDSVCLYSSSWLSTYVWFCWFRWLFSVFLILPVPLWFCPTPLFIYGFTRFFRFFLYVCLILTVGFAWCVVGLGSLCICMVSSGFVYTYVLFRSQFCLSIWFCLVLSVFVRFCMVLFLWFADGPASVFFVC
jgi:hypothetical protein